MKANEIIFRQNRIVYTLMIVLAGLGLLWGFWDRQHKAAQASPTSAAPAAPVRPAATATFSR
ncbi:hypothetical protein FNT36_19270 [Hymenobacter setariae]|uniref:Uncharacterized protein n=1 Tax=Hymenobacter setariae TaxID=2594794 RepID=A0A558BP91_9BACT|nr:hypothetical protein [Hymenobacter setariae]TVT38340.1 hypothetical protein FNT36_19270 [Hymenobacter setariae]